MKRGPKSSADVLPFNRQQSSGDQAGAAPLAERPEPRPELTDAEAIVWRQVVATKPPEWFDAGTWPVLKEYCRVCVQLDIAAGGMRNVHQTLEEGETLNALYFAELVDAQDKLRGKLKALSAHLRLGQQSRYDAQKAGVHGRPASAARKPWE